MILREMRAAITWERFSGYDCGKGERTWKTRRGRNQFDGENGEREIFFPILDMYIFPRRTTRPWRSSGRPAWLTLFLFCASTGVNRAYARPSPTRRGSPRENTCARSSIETREWARLLLPRAPRSRVTRSRATTLLINDITEFHSLLCQRRQRLPARMLRGVREYSPCTPLAKRLNTVNDVSFPYDGWLIVRNCLTRLKTGSSFLDILRE